MPAKKDRQPAATPAAVTDYLAALAEDRREALTAVRKTVLAHLPSGYEEVMDYGMIAWQVPLSVYPDTYNQKPLMFAALASQKNHMALYLCNAYADPALKAQVEAGFKAAGKKLDMGKSCIRFKKLSDLPLPVIAGLVAATPMQAFIERDRSVHPKKH